VYVRRSNFLIMANSFTNNYTSAGRKKTTPVSDRPAAQSGGYTADVSLRSTRRGPSAIISSFIARPLHGYSPLSVAAESLIEIVGISAHRDDAKTSTPTKCNACTRGDLS